MTKTTPSARRSASTKTPSAERAPETTTTTKPNSERRNEITHPDGAAAVAAVSCPSCKARKGAQCIRHDGERTKHVHSARMQKAGK